MSERRILLVDDDRHDRAMTVLVLGREPGVEVVEVSDAVEFAERLARGQFDLVIAERRLGWGDGLRVAEAVKALYPDRPVLLLTREVEPRLVSEGVALGLDALLPKSSEGYLELAATVARLFERRAEGGAAETARRRLTENLPVGVFSVSPVAGIARANPALAAILGCQDPAELWGEAFDLFLADPETRTAWRRALATGQKLAGVEVKVARRDGTSGWARLSAWPIPRDGSEPRILDGTLEDITAYKRAEQELGRRADELDRVNTELRDFAHVVSHDLQAPLTRIEGYTRLLSDELGKKVDVATRDHLDQLRAAAERLQGMLGAILEYSRVEVRGTGRGPVELETVVDEVLANLRGEIEAAGAEVSREPLPEVTADRAQMLLLFQNLIGNALKFRRPGTVPAVHLSASENRGGWAISVADNGLGIEPEAQGRIFGMFERLHPETEIPGTGVGLAICQRIVDRHGGSIEVESVPGEGSKFIVHLPNPS